MKALAARLLMTAVWLLAIGSGLLVIAAGMLVVMLSGEVPGVWWRELVISLLALWAGWLLGAYTGRGHATLR